MILLPSEFEKFGSELGSKTLHLKRLQDAGFSVPPFVAVPQQTVKNFYQQGRIDSDSLAELAVEIREKFPCSTYAVRSSGLAEDSARTALAGKFKTQLAQNSGQLTAALREVIEDAYSQGQIEHFSLIIQEYIEADFAGVTFTRNPKGGREMVVEYHQGRGEELVSGKVKPWRSSFYWYQAEKILPFNLSSFEEAFMQFQAIEKLFAFPQDIEWCIRRGKWYFLQARPITTLNEEQYRQYLYLDQHLPQHQHFLFEKNEISEIAPRPRPFTWSLLEQIYQEGGPVQKVYQQKGIFYRYTNFLKTVGNELYIDKEKDLISLMPAFTYEPFFDGKPRFRKFSLHFFADIVKSIKNICCLQFFSFSRFDVLSEVIEERLKEDLDFNFTSHASGNFSNNEMMYLSLLKDALRHFFVDYEVIYEINLLASKAFSKLEAALKNEPLSMAAALALSFNDDHSPKLENLFSTSWIGNSLDIADESAFSKKNTQRYSSYEAEKYFKSFSTFKKQYLQKFIILAQKFDRLREYGRFLTVKNIDHIRRILFKIADYKNFSDVRHIYFFTLSELLENKEIDEMVARKRREDYEALNAYEFLGQLRSTSQSVVLSQPLGVSAGKAQGILVDLAHIDKNLKQNILYVPMLLPSLTEYFDYISGIVSDQGGLLSHLAIMARERHIPVIVNFDLAHSSFVLGDNVEMDGSSGRIVRLEV